MCLSVSMFFQNGCIKSVDFQDDPKQIMCHLRLNFLLSN
jgi:hypothetical protein